MKKIVVIILALSISYGCKDDFTDIAPQGSLDANLLANEEGVDLLLIGAYAMLTGQRASQGADWHGAGDNWWFDAISDDAHKGSTNGDQADLFRLETFNWDTGNPYPDGKFRSLYAGVNRANAMIVQANALDGEFTNQIAQARFLRGHFHFEAQRIWRNVPYVSDADAGDPNLPNPGPIWDDIEADFQFAVDNLPDTQDDAGRPTSWAARAYLGKVHMYQGEFTEALAQFDEVITNGPYALNDEYLDNFTAGGENGDESIFAIQFSNDDGQSFNGNRGGTLNYPQGGPFGSCCGFYQPTQDLVNAYQTDGSGLPLLDTYNQTDVTNDQGLESEDDFTPHSGPLDPRLDYTVGRRGIDYNGFGPHPGKIWIREQSDAGPYLPKKNIYQAGLEAQGTGAWGQQRSGINYNVIRYADVLLMAAEAEVEVGSLATALDYVNMIRERAMNSAEVSPSNTNYEISLYPAFADQTFARQAVRFERRLELAMEGHRLFDLRRWGVGAEVMNAYFPNEARTITSFASNPYESRHDVFPIPIQAIDLSNGVLTQNPEWGGG